MSGPGTSLGLTEDKVERNFPQFFHKKFRLVAVAVMRICMYIIVLICLTHTGWGTNLKEKKVYVKDRLDYSRKLFTDFVKKYGKVYADEKEFNKRLEIFKSNMEKIKWLQDTEQGTARYKITQFSDMTQDELFGSSRVLKEFEEPTERVEAAAIKIPDSFDWRKRGIVTPVRKGHMDCNTDWALAATGNIESQWALNKGKLIQMSAQQIVDCSINDPCHGGLVAEALNYVANAGGLQTEKDYPFEMNDTLITCKFVPSKVVAKISDFKYLSDNEGKIAQWLYQNGPISVRFNSGRLAAYAGGIIYPKKGQCYKYNLVASGLVVGYGTEKSSEGEVIPYWIIKGFLGKNWGENGYFRIHRGSGACGINKMAVAAFV